MKSVSKLITSKSRGLRGEVVREILDGTTVALLIRVSGAALAFLFQFLLARSLGAEGAGVFYLGIAVVSVVGIFGLVGLENTVVRFIAADIGSEAENRVELVYRKAFIVVLTASAVAAIATFASSSNLAFFVFDDADLWPVLQVLAIVVVPSCLVVLHSAALRGIRRVGWAMFVQPGGVLIPGVAVSLLLILGAETRISDVTSIYVIAVSFSACVSFVAWVKFRPVHNLAQNGFPTSKLLRSSVPLLWANVGEQAVVWAPIALLGFWHTSSDVGILGVCERIAAVMGFLLVALNSVVAPIFATKYKQGRLDELAKIARRSSMILALTSLPILFLFMFQPVFILGFFGEEFASSGAGVLRILTAGHFVDTATGSVGFLLIMTGHEAYVRNVVVVMAIVFIVIGALVIPVWGLHAAAALSAVVLASKNLVLAMVVRKKLGFNPIGLAI